MMHMHIFIFFRHVFHKSCVDPWLLEQRSCPMCKSDILRAFGMHVSMQVSSSSQVRNKCDLDLTEY